MTKYKLLEKIPHTDYEVGEIFEVQESSNSVQYKAKVVDGRANLYILTPHEILLMVKAGILEEVKEEEFPKYGDEYWYINDEGNPNWAVWAPNTSIRHEYRQKVGIWKTKAEAQAALTKIMEK